jgi:hypothetical protein
MSTKKAILEKSRDVLVDKAEDCSDLAKVQRASADKQHESAHKLEKLSRALEGDAAEIKEELERDAQEAAPRLRKRLSRVSAEPETSK